MLLVVLSAAKTTQTGGTLVRMFASEFDEIFEKFPIVKQLYGGCFSSDRIPKNIKQKHFIICNTANSDSEGEHWYTFVKVSKTEVECFDPLGISSDKEMFLSEHCQFHGVQEITFNETWYFAYLF